MRGASLVEIRRLEMGKWDTNSRPQRKYASGVVGALRLTVVQGGSHHVPKIKYCRTLGNLVLLGPYLGTYQVGTCFTVSIQY